MTGSQVRLLPIFNEEGKLAGYTAAAAGVSLDSVLINKPKKKREKIEKEDDESNKDTTNANKENEVANLTKVRNVIAADSIPSPKNCACQSEEIKQELKRANSHCIKQKLRSIKRKTRKDDSVGGPSRISSSLCEVELGNLMRRRCNHDCSDVAGATNKAKKIVK